MKLINRLMPMLNREMPQKNQEMPNMTKLEKVRFCNKRPQLKVKIRIVAKSLEPFCMSVHGAAVSNGPETDFSARWNSQPHTPALLRGTK